jgi:hypothetical protein
MFVAARKASMVIKLAVKVSTDVGSKKYNNTADTIQIANNPVIFLFPNHKNMPITTGPFSILRNESCP